jgi:glycosyltransferase involved in cell wall biosynthesis
MKNKNQFTVAICTRNRSQFIKKLIQDLKSQTLVPFQYIFVENIKEQQNLSLQQLSQVLNHHNISYFTTIGNKAVSQNICLNNCLSNPIIFLDDDIHLKPDSFEKIILAFKKYKNATGFSTCTVHQNLGSYSKFMDYWYNWGHTEDIQPCISPFTATTVLCLNTKTLKKYSIKYNEHINHTEDIDLYCQLVKNNLSLYYLPQVIIQHSWGNRQNILSFLKRFYEYGYNNYRVSVSHSKSLSYDWLIPSRKLDLIFYPLFFLKNVIKQVANFKKDNPTFPIYFFPLVIVVFASFHVGIIFSHFSYESNRY